MNAIRTTRVRSGKYVTQDGKYVIQRERTLWGRKLWIVYERQTSGLLSRLFVLESLRNARIELAYELILREMETSS